jgi:hypothetical protein
MGYAITLFGWGSDSADRCSLHLNEARRAAVVLSRAKFVRA